MELSNYAAIKRMLVSQTGIEISANTFLILFHMFSLILEHRTKPTVMTISHLALIHIMMLLSLAFLMFTHIFGSKNVLDDFTYRSLVYICTTCLLSMLQAITISPNSSWLTKFKFTSPCDIFHFFLFLWFLNMSICSNLFVYAVSSFNTSGLNLMYISEYCSFYPVRYIIRDLVLILLLVRDVTFVGAMLISSAYMVILLYQHKRQSQHLHSTRFTPRLSPEQRASQTILLLVSFFVVMCWVDLIISSSLILLWTYDPVVLQVQRIVVTAYATVSPLVLISSDKRIVKVLQTISVKSHKQLTN